MTPLAARNVLSGDFENAFKDMKEVEENTTGSKIASTRPDELVQWYLLGLSQARHNDTILERKVKTAKMAVILRKFEQRANAFAEYLRSLGPKIEMRLMADQGTHSPELPSTTPLLSKRIQFLTAQEKENRLHGSC